MRASKPNCATILLVEDNPADYETALRAFRSANMSNPIHRCEDGDEAIEFLNATRTLPALILLDLNLPGTDGRELLVEIKQSPRLKWIPVIALTTSASERDVRFCYENGAAGYMQKPVNLNEFRRAIQRLRDFWFEVVILPGARRGERGI